MKFVAISDTHGKHKELLVPDADVVIHGGDITMRGEENEVVDFLEWYKKLPHKYKIFIAGNHDFYFERQHEDQIAKLIPDNIIYLCNNSISIKGVNIWGSPVTPWFFDWAFNCKRGDEIKRYWDMVPLNTNILITHGPAFSRLDKTVKNENVGCKDLLEKIREVKPQFHICGHIHESYGQHNMFPTKLINASVVNRNYEVVNKPIEFKI